MFDARPSLANSGRDPHSALPAAAPASPASFATVLRHNLNMDRFKEFRQENMANLRPWLGEFLNREQFSVPEGYGAVQSRLGKNVGYFQSNYLIILLILLAYCIFQHILLAFILIGIVGAYIYIVTLPPEYSVQVGGAAFTKQHMIYGLVIAAILTFIFTSVGSAFIWLAGTAGFIIGMHATFHEPTVESDFGQRV